MIYFNFYHFLCVHHDMSIAVNALGPHFRSILPYLNVIVETHGEVVGNEIFSGHSKVERVPVLEFL